MTYGKLAAGAALICMASAAAAQAPIVIGKGGTGGTGGRPPPPKSVIDARTLAQPLAPSYEQWKVGQPPSLLPRAATHVCVLGSVSGNFAGGGERVALYIDGGATGGPRWVLNGTSAQAELSATATCAPRAKFVSPSGALPVGTGHTNHMTGSCAPHVVQMPLPHATHGYFISGMAGKWRGEGESITATRHASGKGAIRVHGCSGFADGTLMSVGFGGSPIKYRTLSGITTNPDAATMSIGFKFEKSDGEFYSGDRTLYIAPVNEALCGLTKLAGKFQGYGENAGIYPEKNPNDGRYWWKMNIGSQANLSAISMSARCIARDQR